MLKIKNKKIIIVLITLITISIINIFVQASTNNYYDPVTPNGTIIPYQNISTEMTSTEKYKFISDEQEYIDNGAIRITEPTNQFNSHSFAWYNQSYESNNYIISNDDVTKYFEDGSYCESSGNDGDIICYWRIKLIYSDGTKTSLSNEKIYLAHSGIITSVNGTFNPDDLTTLKNITVISKWGKGGLFEHSGENNPYYFDSIHGGKGKIDYLHFDDVTSNYVDDALFYVKTYTPRINKSINVNFSKIPYTFEETISSRGYFLYKLKINDSGVYKFQTESTALTDIKIYNENMNLLFDQEDTSLIKVSSIEASLSAGIYYMRVSLKNQYISDTVKTSIICLSEIEKINSGILNDTQLQGSEIFLNGGGVNDDTITEGFTRYLYLNSAIAPSTSRLDYDWYSSNPGKASVSKYGTVLAKNGSGNQEVKITAIYKKDRSIIFSKTFKIIKDLKSFSTDPIILCKEMTIEKNKLSLIALPDNAPYNFNQYYTWSSNDSLLSVSNYGSVRSYNKGTYIVSGAYNYNKRIKIIITIYVQ